MTGAYKGAPPDGARMELEMVYAKLEEGLSRQAVHRGAGPRKTRTTRHQMTNRVHRLRAEDRRTTLHNKSTS